MGLVVALAAADVTGDGVPEIAVADAQGGVIRLLAFTGLGLGIVNRNRSTLVGCVFCSFLAWPSR